MGLEFLPSVAQPKLTSFRLTPVPLALSAPCPAPAIQIQKISKQASETSMDALGPVFNTVLSSINSDFERKLSAKDQEVTRARESVAAMQGQMVEVQRQLRQVQRQLEVQQQDLEGGRSVASEEVKAEAARLTQQLAETQQRCFELESQVR